MHRLLVCMLATVIAIPALAQERATPRLGPVSPPTAQPPTPVQKPTVEADISTRSLEVTTGFTGHEIIVFGAVDNSQAPQEHGGYYDVVVVVEGTPFPVVVR